MFHADHLTPEQLYKNRWKIHAVMSMGLILIVMAISSLNVTLPVLQRNLHASATDLQWIVDGYALVFAGLVLFGGALGDRFGRRKAFITGMVVFAVTSFLCAVASGPEALIVYRSIMGIGAALIMPATLSIISNAFRDDKERAKAVAMWAGFAGASGAIGPIISGLVLKYFWWGAVFALPIPVAILAIVLTTLIVPESRDPEAEKLDVIGAILSIVGLGTLLYGVIEAPNNGWLDSQTITFIVAGIAILVGFFLWEKSSRHPMLPVRFFRSRRFTTGSLSLILTFFALFGMFFILIQYMQFVLGFSPLGAAIRTLPAPVSLIFAASVVTRIEQRVGTKKVVTLGLLIVSGGFLIFTRLGVDNSPILLYSGMAAIGIGMGFAMPPATEAIIGSVPKRKAGVGSAMNDTTREFGGALGIAVLGSVLTSAYRSDIGGKLGGFSASAAAGAKSSVGGAIASAGQAGAASGRLLDTSFNSFVHAMSVTMWVAVGFLLASALLVYIFMIDSEAPIPDDEPDVESVRDLEVSLDLAEIAPETI
jgi:EmrB/QacA subfamily drug resistance transporter